MEKKIEIGQNAKVEVTWNTTQSKYSKDTEEGIKHNFALKYGIPEKNVSVVVNYINNNNGNGISLNYENIHDIQDPKFQQELMKSYISDNGIEDYDFDEIVKIDSQINSLIDYDRYEKSKKYSIKWMKWKNILSYGNDNFFDFTKLKGLVLLKGEPANKSGKSTFAYDLLHILLFGKTRPEKAETLGQLFNNYLPEETEAFIEGCINFDGNDYIIKRTFTRAAKSKKAVRTASQKIEYFKILENGERKELQTEENLQGSSSTETSKIIKEAIGNEEDFNLIISANAKDLDELISLKETARGKLLSRWIGLSPIEDKDVKAREIWNKQISKGRYCDIYSSETLKTEITTLKENISENEKVIKDLTNKNNEIDEVIKKETESKENLLSSKQKIDSELFKYDVHTLEQKLANIVEDGKKKRVEAKAVSDEISAYPEEIIVDEERYKAIISENNDLIGKISEIKTNILNLQKTNKLLASQEYCPTCGRKFENVDNSKIIAENEKTIADYTEKGKNLNDSLQALKKEMSDIEKNRELYKEKNKLQLKLSAVNIEIERLLSDYKENTRILNDINNMHDAIAANNKIDTEVNCITAKIQSFDKTKRENSENINILSKENEASENTIKTKQSYIVKIEEEIKTEKNWKLYLKMIGKDGISKMVLKNTLPIINNELHRLLHDVCDFDVEVTINDKNDVEFWLIRDSVYSKLSSASGLETTQAALALRVVLGNMSSLSKPPFILLDEILGTVAKESYDDMKVLYNKIVKNYDFILHITHLDLDWHDGGTITVSKKNNISSIKSSLC